MAQINKNTAEKARAYYNLAEAYYLASDFHQQIEYLKQYLSIAEEVGDRAGARRAYHKLGCAYGFLGDYQQKTSGLPRNLVTEQVKDVPMAISAILIATLKNFNEQ